MEADDVGVAELFEDGGLLLEDGGEEVGGVGIVFGSELDGEVVAIARSQFDPEWGESYLPKVPSPRV